MEIATGIFTVAVAGIACVVIMQSVAQFIYVPAGMSITRVSVPSTVTTVILSLIMQCGQSLLQVLLHLLQLNILLLLIVKSKSGVSRKPNTPFEVIKLSHYLS